MKRITLDIDVDKFTKDPVTLELVGELLLGEFPPPRNLLRHKGITIISQSTFTPGLQEVEDDHN